MKYANPGTINQARANILGQGIQQTNRYQMYYPKMVNEPLYPYNITLPGLGYDFIDHSIWSIQRKIPFRKTFTDLEVTFIVGNSNYSNAISWWSSAVSGVRGGSSTGGQNGGTSLSQVAAANGVSPSAVEGPPETVLGGLLGTLGEAIDEITALADPITNNVEGFANGSGGASNYIDKFYHDGTLIIQLMDEKAHDKPKTTLVFTEAYISQIAQVNLTSVETGYSPFKIFFKFATVRAES